MNKKKYDSIGFLETRKKDKILKQQPQWITQLPHDKYINLKKLSSIEDKYTVSLL